MDLSNLVNLLDILDLFDLLYLMDLLLDISDLMDLSDFMNVLDFVDLLDLMDLWDFMDLSDLEWTSITFQTKVNLILCRLKIVKISLTSFFLENMEIPTIVDFAGTTMLHQPPLDR